MSSPTPTSKSRITNPRRILVLTPSAQSGATVPPFLHALTGARVQETRNATDSHTRTSRSIPPEEADSATETETESVLSDNNNLAHQASFAGYTTHSPLRLDTKYYTADVPIWVDEVPLSSTDSSPSSSHSPTAGATASIEQHPTATQGPSAWTSEFLSPEAREVRDAIAAIVLCIQPPEPVARAVPSSDAAAQQGRKDVDSQAARLKEFVGAVAAVKGKMDEERGGMGDVAALLVLVRGSGDTGDLNRGEEENGPKAALEEPDEFGSVWWDEELCDMGVFDFEVVSWRPGGQQDEQRRNEFGELEGIARVREILEASEWAPPEDGDEDGLQGLLGETIDDKDGFDLEASELEKEMLDLRLAIEKGGDDHAADDGGHDDDLNDDQLETLMSRVQAIRDMGSDMPEAERRQFAAKAIRDIMQDV